MKRVSKRVISLFMSLLMLTMLIPTAALAAGTFSASAANVEAEATEGTTVDVPIKLTENAGLTGLVMRVAFDNTSLKLIGFSGEDKIIPGYNGSKKFEKANNDGNYKLSWANDLMEDNVTKTGTLITLSFEVLSSAAAGKKTLTITEGSALDVSMSKHAVSATNGSITLLAAPITSVSFTLADPAKGTALPDIAGLGSGYTGAVEWYEGKNATGSPVSGNAKPNQVYTAKVTLTANTADGESFANSVTFPTGYTKDSNDGTKLVLTKTFDATGSFPAATVTAVPTAKSGLKYDGTEQVLLGFMGTANGGTMQYSLDNSTWSDAIPKGKNAGEHTVYYKVVGDSTHSDSVVAHISAKIDPKEISGVTIVSIADQPYTGSAITPDPVVTDGTATLEKDKDYTVSCAKNTYVGTADLTITGTGNYTETKGATFTITAVDQNPTFTTPKDLAKGGHRIDLRTLVQDAKGKVTFAISGVTSTYANLESDGYTLTSTIYPGTVNINVSIAAGDENNDGTSEYNAFHQDNAITVNVVDRTSDTTTMKVSQGDITYGDAVSPSVTNKPADTGTVSFTYEGRDGTTYASTSTPPTAVGKYKVKATCDSSTTTYTAEDTFEILPKSISGMTVTLDKTSLEYNGSAQTVNVTGVGSLSAADYTVTSGNSGTDVDSYTVTVTGKGNYKDTATATWKITQATLTVIPVANQSKKFKEADPALTYNCSGNVSGQTPAFNGKLDREAGENAGVYAIELGDLALKDNGAFKASNYTLQLSSTTVNFKITQAAAPTLADIKLNQRYTVTTEQSKDIGTAGMPDDAGTLTYREGTPALVTGSVTIVSGSVDATGKVTYKLSGGKAGDTVTLPVIIGSDNYEDATANVKITLVRGSSGGGSSAAVAPDMPLLRYGSRGEAVKTLQEKLNAKGYNSGNVDGIFGTKTRAAVISFQKATGLGVDGIVGKLTWAKLYDAAPVSVVAPATTAQPMLRSGSRGDAVRKLQELLNARGHNCGAVDGIFGVKTRAAVIAFQKANGLSADGIVGPLTWGKLI